MLLDLEGLIFDFNSYIEKVLGYKKEKYIGTNFFNFPALPSDIIPLLKKELELYPEDVDLDPLELQIIKNDGTLLWIHSQTSLIELNRIKFLMIIFQDITEKRKAQESLRESEEKFRTIAEESMVGIAILQDNSIIYINQQVADIIGYSIKELMEMKTIDFLKRIHPNDVKMIAEETRIKQLGHKDAKAHAPFRAYKKNGDLVYFDNYSKTISYRGKNAILAILVDNTEKVKAEEKLKNSEIKYREAYNRSNLYKDLFSHDINNILHNILTSIELSKMSQKDPDFTKVFDIANEQIIRGKELARNVQKLSEVEEVGTPISAVEAIAILKKSIEFAKGSYPHKMINIELKSFQNKYFVNANELLVNVFDNILFNSIIHNTNSNIDVQIFISEIKKLHINFVKFEFLDNGIGIQASMKQEIFLRDTINYKKEKVPSGIGLGLLLIKRILDRYKGEIKVEDRVPGDYSKGCKFIILIPEAK